VALVSLGSFVCSMVPTPPRTERDGFAAAMADVPRENGPGTFVVVWPPEYAAALAALPPELAAADAVPAETNNKRSYLKILTLGPAGFDPPPELDSADSNERVRFDDIEVTTHQWTSGDRIDFDLRAGLAEVAVQLHGREHHIDCNQARADGGWACPGRPGWNHVAPTHLRVEGDDWPCVWAHPVTGHDLIFDLGERTLWDRIEVEAALHDDVTGAHGSSVVVKLEVDGVGSRRITRTNNRGVAITMLPTTRGQKARVRLFVNTGNDGRRHLGVNLRILEER